VQLINLQFKGIDKACAASPHLSLTVSALPPICHSPNSPMSSFLESCNG